MKFIFYFSPHPFIPTHIKILCEPVPRATLRAGHLNIYASSSRIPESDTGSGVCDYHYT
jgi:hypothetical protein